jgi:uncharacterized membrane protein HdeD (DUF308 family)
MAKRKEVCGCPMCKGMKGHAVMKIVLGLLVLGNAYYPTLSWPAFIGALILAAGIAKLFHACE